MIEQSGQRVLEDLGTDAGFVRRVVEGLIAIELVGEQAVRLVPDSEVQCKVGADAPRIAEIPAGLSAAPLLQFAAVLGKKRESAQQKIGAVEAFRVAESRGVAIELELAGAVKLRVVVEPLANEAHAPNQVVVALLHSPVVLQFQAAAAEADGV